MKRGVFLMPGSENLIWGTEYYEPYSRTCYQRICAFGVCRNIPYPCIGMRKKYYKVFIGYNYPSVSEAQQLIIHGCAKVAIDVATPIVTAAVASCAGIGPACIGAVALAAIAANKAGRESFHGCLKTAGLPQEIISQCEIGVYDRKGNA
ncbi:hypothetical protein PQS33_16980 [Bacillus altitudinis]|uniref:hypothetical protein n=1 Tax=Bacillus altitudinis TaxID=293387 RepID=UPI00397AABDA